ncbi:MAG: CarD family transcriptional regulator [Lachnospiraceae bacterium]|nr:CarD family transcriptional regulator [Lachnospiraceae bacterium]
MFQENDMVVYGGQSVCEVVSVGPLPVKMAMGNAKQEYYTLRPIYQRDSLVYVPIGNEKVVMRYVITEEEAKELVNKIPGIKAAWIEKDSEREQEYKRALSSCDPEQLIMIIKALYKRRQARIDDGKKVTVVDERYFKMAEKQLYEELAYALHMQRDEVGDYIAEFMKRSKNKKSSV